MHPTRRWCLKLIPAAAILPSALAVDPPVGVILLLGPPGSGKTTQANKLKTALRVPVFSPPPGASASEALKTWLGRIDSRRGFILDGYPTTLAEAEQLDALLRERRLLPPLVVHLSVPDSVADQRLEARGQRADTPANVERRIVEYREAVAVILPRYKDRVVTIDGTRNPDRIASEIRLSVASKINGK